jgi:recombination protein RecA
MNTAAELRKQIESALGDRIPGALSVRPVAIPELVPCGVAEVDAALGGGLPLGGIAELSGPASSGRTTLALAVLAEVTRQGGACAYVDTSDSLDPLSAAATGVELRRLLWVRAGGAESNAEHGSRFMPGRELRASAPASSASSTIQPQEKSSTGRGGRHPRSEAVGMDRAVGELFRGQHKAEIRSTEDGPDFTARCAEPVRRKRPEPAIYAAQFEAPRDLGPPIRAASAFPEAPASVISAPVGAKAKPWSRLDRALRASDLLLNAGGFRAVVLDLADVHPEHARRVPLATWYRFRLQVEKSQTLFLLLTRVTCANSCATVTLHCGEASADWRRASANSPELLAGLRYSVEITRNRIVDIDRKKPAGSVRVGWSGATSWCDTARSSKAAWSR